MKLLFTLIMLIGLSSTASAQSVCYKATSDVGHALPEVLCLDSIAETTTSNKLSVESQDSWFPKELNIDSISRHNEDRLRLKTSAVLVDKWESNCGEKLFALLNVDLEIITGEIHPNFLAISLSTEYVKDSCNGRAVFENIKYELLK